MDLARYLRPDWHPNSSPLAFAHWALRVPFLSASGAARIADHASGRVPARWRSDFARHRVLVMGSGPSLDRVDDRFVSDYDSVVHINFALRRARGRASDYFFTTDAGPIRQYGAAHGFADFAALGPERAIFAPVFQDQWHAFTPAGRALFTWLAPDRTGWRLQRARGLPLVWRRHPVQPRWDSFRLPAPGRTLPVLDHSSALTAVMFAAIHGARTVDLIGCDFAAGRALSAESPQAVPDARLFSGAATELRRMIPALARHGVPVRNRSWEV